jgi:DNA repair photolyase
MASTNASASADSVLRILDNGWHPLRGNHVNRQLSHSPFFIGLGRAMVSLGPLSAERYCPFSCQFCYVQGPFPRYPTATPTEIVKWLTKRRGQFKIVYVSGDTDSFAPGRTHLGLALLDSRRQVGTDVLFTTRHVFDSADSAALRKIAAAYRSAGLLLVACISISQLNYPALEPPPIRPPSERIEQMRLLREAGVVTVLTIRPFIPGIPAHEYCTIVDRGHVYADIVVGGDLYLDTNGYISRLIEKAIGMNPRRATTEEQERALDFSLDPLAWHIEHYPEACSMVARRCDELNKPFFVRSGPAIDLLRAHRIEYLRR